jgi:His/Glu/Gln/Arg/opine family amino acid ABC transporter permease subunit
LLFVGCALAGNVLALPVALARISERRWLRYPAIGFILAFRGTPLLVQLYLAYFGIGQVLASFPSIRYSPTWPLFRSAYCYAFLTLSLNTAAYCGEIWRGAILGVPKGQSEAGKSLGLSKGRIMLLILLPQALRLALPAIGGQNILLLKGTALAATITVFELMAAANIVRAQTFRVYEPLLAAALVYFLLAVLITCGFKFVEKRLTLSG